MKKTINSEYFKAKIIPNSVWAIEDRDFDMIYLVEGKDFNLLIDTGMGIGDIGKFIKKINPKPAIVVNTHGDPDHCGGNYQFPEAFLRPDDFELTKQSYEPNYRKYVADAFVELSSKKLPLNYNDWVTGKNTVAEEIISFNDWIDSEPSRMIPVRAGHIFDLGGRKLEVIEIPGHSAGSIALIDYDARMLFTGDSVLPQDIWMFLERCTSLNTYLNSIKHLKKIEQKYDTILPGHGNISLDIEYVNDLIECSGNILKGSCTGNPIETFVGNGLKCKYGNIAIIYNKDKLI